MNLYGKYRLSRDLKLSGGIGNVFDRKYAAHLSGINRAAGSDVAVGERVPGRGAQCLPRRAAGLVTTMRNYVTG